VFVAVDDFSGGQTEIALGLDAGAGVDDAVRPAASVVIGVEAAADGEVALAVDECVVAVAEGGDGDVEALARGDHRGLGLPIRVLGFVAQGSGGDGEVVAVDAAGAEVDEAEGRNEEVVAVDEAAVDEGLAAGGDELDGIAADAAAGLVVEAGGLQAEGGARLEPAEDAEGAGGFQVALPSAWRWPPWL